jgi:hypothetical protein
VSNEHLDWAAEGGPCGDCIHCDFDGIVSRCKKHIPTHSEFTCKYFEQVGICRMDCFCLFRTEHMRSDVYVYRDRGRNKYAVRVTACRYKDEDYLNPIELSNEIAGELYLLDTLPELIAKLEEIEDEGFYAPCTEMLERLNQLIGGLNGRT